MSPNRYSDKSKEFKKSNKVLIHRENSYKNFKVNMMNKRQKPHSDQKAF